MLSDYGSIASDAQYQGIDRLFIGSYALCAYLIKSIIPYRLSPLYPYPEELSLLFKASILIFPLYAAAVYMLWKKGKKVWVFGLLFFLGNVILMLQIVGAGQAFQADRFTYIAYFGLFYIMAYYIQPFLGKSTPSISMYSAGAVTILLIYSGLTFRQTYVWENSDTMWSHVIKYYNNVEVPYRNRANYYRDQGENAKALRDYIRVLEIDPENHEAYNSRGMLYFNKYSTQDSLQLALDDYNNAISLSPDNGEYKINKGAALAKMGRLTESLPFLSEGLNLKPDHVTGYINRSIVLRQMGRFDQALKDYDSYISYNPYNADIWYEKGNVEAAMKRYERGIQSIAKAISINPNKGIYHYRQAEAFTNLNRINEARAALSQAIALGYTKINPELRRTLGM